MHTRGFILLPPPPHSTFCPRGCVHCHFERAQLVEYCFFRFYLQVAEEDFINLKKEKLEFLPLQFTLIYNEPVRGGSCSEHPSIHLSIHPPFSLTAGQVTVAASPLYPSPPSTQHHPHLLPSVTKTSREVCPSFQVYREYLVLIGSEGIITTCQTII